MFGRMTDLTIIALCRVGATSRIELSTSDDGVHFTRRGEPVLYPDEDDQKMNEWDGGCEDPRVIATPDGSFVMTYTQWNGNIPRLATATSRDLVNWTKHGPVFAADSAEIDSRGMLRR